MEDPGNLNACGTFSSETMLTRKAAETVVSLLSNQTDPVSSIHAEFTSLLHFSERVIALTDISILLSDAVLDHYQQIAAAWIIYAEFEDLSLNENPFLPTLVYINSIRAENPNKFSPALCDLLPIILSGTPLDFLRTLTIPQIVQGAFSAPNSTPKPITPVSKSDEIISPIIVTVADEKGDMTLNEALINLMTTVDLSNSFECPMGLPIPDVMEVSRSEIEYISSMPVPFLFDSGVLIDHGEDITDLLHRACTNKLSDKDTAKVLNAIEKYQSLIDASNLTDQQITSMIENNDRIASGFIGCLVKKRPEKWSIVTRLGISPYAAEVVKYLFTKNLFTSQAAEEYISNTIVMIESMKDNKRQLSKGAMFCKLMNVYRPLDLKFSNQNLLITFKGFCMNMAVSGVKDAQELFDTIKSNR